MFRAKSHRRHLELVQERQGTGRKPVGRLASKVKRQLDDEVHPIRQGGPGSFPLINDCGFAPLGKVAAHYGNGHVSASLLFGLLDIVGVPIVKGIKLNYHSHCLHFITYF